MQYSQEIYRLALKNVALIEKAVTVLSDVDERVISSINKYIHEYIQDAEAGFYAFATYEDDGYIGFMKNEWKEGNDKKWRTSFQFWGEGEDFDDAWWVSLLMGRGACTLGFYFYINSKQIGGNERSQWKECVRRAFTENNLGKDGFMLNKDGMAILYPVSFEMSDLLAMLPEKEGEDLPKDAPCFANIKKALDKIVEKITVFDELAQKARDLNR